MNRINKKGKGPGLTWIFIGIAIAITSLTLSFTIYENFLNDNNISLTDDFSTAHSNIDSIKNNTFYLGSENGGLADRGLLKEVWNAASGTVNVFVMGLSAISEFFRMISIIDDIFSLIENVIPGFNALFGLFTLIITVYISFLILKAKRGSPEIA